MAWERGGVAMDEFVKYLEVHESSVYSSYSERGLRLQLGKALHEELNRDVFSLTVRVDGRQVSQYFVGEAPDLEAIISEVMAIPELNAKMKWENEGLTMDEIMTAVIESYPDVQTLYLYVQASPHKTEHGLRVALGMVLDAELNGKVFSLPVEMDGRHVHTYFVGEAPDLAAIISEVMAIPKINAKMKWENGGLTMDEIMAAVIETYPAVHTLYVQASPNKTGVRTAHIPGEGVGCGAER